MNKKSKKIYIIGNVATGKTTLAKYLSKKLNIEYYSLDQVIWDDENTVKRTKKERDKIFRNIIKKDSWIIEDVGRDCFKEGRKKSDCIYFISLKRSTIYLRVIKRWIKQKLNIEEYDYQPTIKSLIEMLEWAKKYKKNKLCELDKYRDKLVILTIKELKNINN